ncbi:MAG: 30S ribosome-binding factor RbfA [Victivallaceae bacterium]|nr:30S ribosome-binding factor RbfA [Victivallaceae bacterium]
MGGSNRIIRINELLKRELGNLITAKNIAPAASVLVSVTRVKTASDLRQALVFVSVFGGGDRTGGETIETLNRRRSEFQHDISQVITLKYTPILKFVLDESIAAGDRIFELLGEVDDNGEK